MWCNKCIMKGWDIDGKIVFYFICLRSQGSSIWNKSIWTMALGYVVYDFMFIRTRWTLFWCFIHGSLLWIKSWACPSVFKHWTCWKLLIIYHRETVEIMMWSPAQFDVQILHFPIQQSRKHCIATTSCQIPDSLWNFNFGKSFTRKKAKEFPMQLGNLFQLNKAQFGHVGFG